MHKPRKYGNKKVTIGGEKFDSAKEARRYGELVLLGKAGQISDLKRQVKFELIPRIGNERPCNYIADFTYLENGELVVEDVKGVKTDAYKIKKKLMLWVHGIRIKET
jgi:hypothetical protein